MFLIFVLPALLIAAFICCVFVRPLPAPVTIKWGLSLFFCFCALGLQLARTIVGGNLFAPNLPTPFLKVMVFLYGFSIIFFILLLLAWFLSSLLSFNAIQDCFPQIKQFDWKTLRNILNLSLLIVAVIAGYIGFKNAMLPPIIKNETFSMRNLPEKASGMKIAFLADLHIDGKITGKERVEALVNQTNELNPDLIVIGGDFVDGTLEELKDEVTPLKDLKAPFGVVGVVGNHEYYSGYHDWVNFLPTLGIKLLLNEEITLDNGLRVAGVTDPTAKGDLPAPDPIKFLPVVPNNFNEFESIKRIPPLLIVSHQPKIIKIINEHHSKFYKKLWEIKEGMGIQGHNTQFDQYINSFYPPQVLQLSGHTHGGMIPILNMIVSLSNDGYLSGRFSRGDELYVTNGTFIWNGFPFRLFCPGEITLITLRGKNLPQWKVN